MNNKNFIFIGDSLTFGYRIPKKENWVNKLNEYLNFNIVNKGINGNTTTDMLMRFSEDVIKNNPSNIFIMGGTNDLLSNRDIEFITKNLQLMIEESLNYGANVTIGIPPTLIPKDAYRLFSPSDTYEKTKELLPILRNKLINICINYNLKFIDFYNLSLDNLDKNIFFDGIHFNSKGQELAYAEALKVLSR